MKILAIESSCDETACAVVEDGISILSNVVASSHEMHEKYGGIVPEVAARLQLESVIPVITEALTKANNTHSTETITQQIKNDIDAIAITVGPGLIGSLLIGVETAKTIALITDKPIVPVNHVLAHMYANFVNDKQSNKVTIEFPAISLVVSGGHTELYLMKSPKDLTWLGGTLDDAAGECFDKTARLLGFGHGGGVAIQNAAKEFMIHSSKFTSKFTSKLPRPMLDKKNELNSSFSGLKTAIMREVNSLKDQNQLNKITIQQLSYDVQESITDVLVKKTLKAAEQYNVKSILLSGGVSSNLRLREKFLSKIRSNESKILTLHVPPVPLCTDNAVYIASYAYFRGTQTTWDKITAAPDLSVESV